MILGLSGISVLLIGTLSFFSFTSPFPIQIERRHVSDKVPDGVLSNMSSFYPSM